MAKPIETLRDGKLKATIWKNEGEKGAFFSVQITSLYEDQAGNLKDGQSFNRNDLLKVALLATKAYERTAELRIESSSATPNDGRVE